MTEQSSGKVALATIAREWGRIGLIGFGGPPAHIALFRRMCVEQRHWLSEHEFEDAVASVNLLPGPASTQLAIFCAWRLRGRVGAMLGGVCFIVPGLIIILALAALFISKHTPLWVKGAAAGAGAAVPAVALNAAYGLVGPSWRRARDSKPRRARWLCYFAVGVAAAATTGSYLVLVLILAGLVEIAVRGASGRSRHTLAFFPAVVAPIAIGGYAALSWVALKIGALSYGGGFIIVPLMQHDVVSTYHWMTGTQFLSAVALGQVTPGPVVQTVAVVGYAAAGLAGGLFAAFVAFAPSFLFVLFGAPHFNAVRSSAWIQAFLVGAGACVIGAIAGSAIPLSRELVHLWQFGLLGAGVLTLVLWRRGVVAVLVGAGAIGVIAVMAGAPH